MARIKELRERRAAIVADARQRIEDLPDDVNAEGRAEAEAAVDKALAESDRIGEEIRRLEALEAAERAVSEVAEVRAGREDTSVDEARDRGMTEDRAYVAWMRDGIHGLNDEQRAFMAARQVTLNTRAQATGTNAAGGFTVPENFRRVLEEAKKAFGGIRPLATVIPTDDGSAMTLPTVDDTANQGAIQAENAAAGEQDVAFGAQTLATHMYSSDMVRVPVQLLEDSAFSFDALMPRLLMRRIARAENAHYATGDGASKPSGFLNGITTVATAGSGAVVYDDLVELIHAVDPEYREMGAFALSDDALKVLRKLKDADGRPIWQESTRAGEPSTICGKPYAVVQEMPAVAAGNSPIAFGDFKSYLIRDVGSVALQRLVERYAEFLQVGFHAYERHGGALLDAGGKPIKALAVAA